MYYSAFFFQKFYKCEDCGMYKGSEKQLKKHRIAHKKGLLSCCVCSKQFEDKNRLDECEDIHVLGRKHYKCLEKSQDGMECGSLYSHKGSLCAHVNDKHGKTMAKSEYQRKDDQDITCESLEVSNARIKGSKQMTSGQFFSFLRCSIKVTVVSVVIS